MSLLPPPDPGRLDPRVRDLVERLPPLPHFQLMAWADSVFEARLAYGQALMTELSIDDRVRETAVLAAAGWAGADYVLAQHEAAGARAGLTPEEVAASRSGRSEELADAQLSATVALVRAMLPGPAPVAVVRTAVAELGERGLVEVGLVVERYLGLGLLLRTLRVAPVPAEELLPFKPTSRPENE